jgi:hypothetical protein
MPTNTEELIPIIQKIKEQSKQIIHEISNSQFPENLLEIRAWIKEIDLESPSINIFLTAITIDAIFFYIKNEFNKEKTSLVEKFLTNLINAWSNLSEHEISELVSYLKTYAKTDDADAQIALKEFIANGESTNFLGDLPKRLMSSCGKSLSNFSKIIKTQLNSQSKVELVRRENSLNQIPFFKDLSPGQFTSYSVKNKKKIKPRIIEFDEEGIGYDNSSPYLFLKEINRLNDINLEIELPEKFKKKLLQENLLKKELERLEKIEINQGGYVNKIERKIKIMEFELFASKEEKEARQRNIEQKIGNNKKSKERQKINKLLIPKILSIQEKIEIYKKTFDSKSLNIEFSLFETTKDDFLVAFLKTIDYEKFKELINFSEYMLNSIDNIRETFKKIDDFSEDLGIASNYMGILDSYYRQIKENFNRERIANFLENALILFKQRTLLLDNNYSLLEMQTKKNAIVFSEPNFLNEFISSYNSRKVYKILYNEMNQFLNINMPKKIKKRKNKMNLIKKLFYFIFNEYYFVDKKSKEKLRRKFFSNISDTSSFESIKNIMYTLKWWEFFLIGISPICIFKKGFRTRLSEEFFLDLLEKKFKKIDIEQELNRKIDMLYDLRNLINSSTFKIHDDSINLNSLNIMNSRQAIICRLKNKIKMEGALFDNVQTLSDQVSSCINEFNNLNFVCRQEIEKASEKNEIFQLNKNDVSKLHFPLKWLR